MKVLVIGGNRFFGRRLVEKFARQQIELTVMNRTGIPEHLTARVRHWKMDRNDLSATDLQGKSWDVVYDQVCYEAPEADKACDIFNGHVGKYVFTSSMSVYGWGDNLKEKDFDPLKHEYEVIADRVKQYAEAKRQCEAVFFKKAKFPVTALRFPIVMGEDDYTERLKFHVDHVSDGKPIYFPSIESKLSLIHAADAARFMTFLVEKDFSGPVNVCAKTPIRLSDLILAIEGKTGVKAKPVLLPNEGDASPYGIEADWVMNTDTLDKLGFQCTPIREWLTVLIARYLKPGAHEGHH